MDQSLIYHSSMGIVGACFLLLGFESLLSEGVLLAPVMMVIGCLIIVLISIHSLSTGKNLEFNRDWMIWFLMSAAVLSLIGTVLVLL